MKKIFGMRKHRDRDRELDKRYRDELEEYGKKTVPQWIEKQAEAFEGKIAAMPSREDIDYEVSENLIVELYSR